MRRALLILVLPAVLALAACAEKPQEMTKKGDMPAWKGAANVYVAAGWKPGDEKSWQTQMKARAQGQDEYSRIRGAN